MKGIPVARVFGLLAILTPTLAACQFIPGTDENRIHEGETIAREMLIDPSSAVFRNSAVFEVTDQKNKKDWAVCGEINGKNRNGAYAGNSRFIAVVGLKQSELEPEVSVSREDAQSLGKKCTRDAKGPFYFEGERDLARMTCEQARDAANERLSLARFELDWETMCGNETGPHLPNLVTTSEEPVKK